MPLAGFMVTKDEFSLFGIIAAGTIGSVLGALPLYYFGRKLGEEGAKNFADNYGKWLTISPKEIENAKNWFDKHGAAAVFFARLIPGVRSLISVPAGIDRMNLVKFLIFTSVGAAIWTSLLACAGYFLGQNFREVENYLDPASYLIVGGIIVFYLYCIFTHKK